MFKNLMNVYEFSVGYSPFNRYERVGVGGWHPHWVDSTRYPLPATQFLSNPQPSPT